MQIKNKTRTKNVVFCRGLMHQAPMDVLRIHLFKHIIGIPTQQLV